MVRVVVRWGLIGAAVLALGVQAVPYGRDHTNPPVRKEPIWDSPQTRELAVRACFDCHSNQTVWPWYSNVAPLSWLIQRDVDQGRRKTNLSEWDRPQKEADESAKTVRKGKMPPWYYPWARFSPTERQALIRGLEMTFGSEERGKREEAKKKERKGRKEKRKGKGGRMKETGGTDRGAGGSPQTGAGVAHGKPPPSCWSKREICGWC